MCSAFRDTSCNVANHAWMKLAVKSRAFRITSRFSCSLRFAFNAYIPFTLKKNNNNWNVRIICVRKQHSLHSARCYIAIIPNACCRPANEKISILNKQIPSTKNSFILNCVELSCFVFTLLHTTHKLCFYFLYTYKMTIFFVFKNYFSSPNNKTLYPYKNSYNKNE